MIQHIAAIMDGNRRWATERGMPKLLGHTQGAKNILSVVKEVMAHDVKFLTLYALSTENLKRSEEELAHLFSLFNKLVDSLDKFIENNVQFRVIGNMSLLPQKTQDKLQEVVEKTSTYTESTLVLTLAVAYGGRDEITRAVQKIMQSNISVEDVTEKSFGDYLDTVGMPDVDLLIRTGGHKRLSNFLPWQSTYAEYYFTDVFWPEFNKKELNKAIDWFHLQKRNKGK
ncbi:di-trans,poly-cis-decaprenylcistransferase [Patescibacteria group bacterium]|nr:di-trans,poly-cis-decaprenylcistransferase [Patescibacteria group bacterium]MBU1722011.1 di-trans,poly-cis-decaprenylcistransferase [Patescibacteria group bacterium]MBU1901239.1 di-trans,poly-cis-decaprenylcistransferase [Patescibacteria group bacterium]